MIPIYTVFAGHVLRECGESTSVRFLDISGLGLPIIQLSDRFYHRLNEKY